MLRPRYVMLGGFLGAGKTTAMLKFAGILHQRGLRVGVITNDQSVGLVDTQLLQSNGHPTAEIAGGCFCCKFDSLWEAAEQLTLSDRPEVLLAEPVGSCTDLRATVSEPLRQLYGEQVVVAPLSVVVDPLRAQRVLGLRAEKQFTAKVNYIYEKQLEESDLIVINKIDLLSAIELEELQQAFQQLWPKKRVLAAGIREGRGVEAWLDLVLAEEMGVEATMEVDYDRYADGESLLGWLNFAGIVKGSEFDGNGWLVTLVQVLRQRLLAAIPAVEIAHLKATLLPRPGNDLGVVNLVRSHGQAELAYALVSSLEFGEWTLNLRAEADPELLRQVALAVLSEMASAGGGPHVEVRSQHAFRPGRPVPVHRMKN